MGSWILKTATQKTISLLPASNRLNELAQKYITHTLDLEPHDEFQGKLEACQRHTDYYQSTARKSIEGARVVELGTGWFSIIPIALFLQGAAEIWTWDIVSRLRRDTFKRTLELFVYFHEQDLLQRILPGVQNERLSQIYDVVANTRRLDPRQVLEQFGIHVLIGDARQSAMESECVDFIFSHQVLEHLNRQHLASMFAEFHRILKKSGVMCHNIGLADQFASFDVSITPFNFLKYSTTVWKLFNNSIIPQNRLRISDYRNVCQETGFRLDTENNLLGDPEDLRSVRLAPEFRRYSFDELLVLESWMVAVKS